MSMYIRLKRKNQTIFLHVELSDNFSSIKQRVAALISLEQHQIMLFGSDKKKELVDLATISDQGKIFYNENLNDRIIHFSFLLPSSKEVKNDDIVYFVTSKPSGGWEEIEVETLLPFGEE